jgi:LPXTG-motif cell wall-anchored protein
MMKFSGMVLLLVGLAGFASAGLGTAPAPEIDPASGVGALALLSGALLVIRSRRKK